MIGQSLLYNVVIVAVAVATVAEAVLNGGVSQEDGVLRWQGGGWCSWVTAVCNGDCWLEGNG